MNEIPAATNTTTKERFAAYIRNFIFGVEDSLVATSGLLSGVAIANTPRRTILLSGLVLIFVEAFSMAAGSFLAETSAEEYMTKREVTSRASWLGGVIMFFSYFISGFIPLFPYLVFAARSAFWISIASSLVILSILGLISARISETRLWKSAFRMLLVGGVAIGAGVAVGIFIPEL